MSNKISLNLLSLAVAVLIIYLAWQSGKNQPPPDWVIKYLAPVLGWMYIGLVIIAIVKRKKVRRHK